MKIDNTFDVFISYKHSAGESLTRDSEPAHQIFDLLDKNSIRVFMAHEILPEIGQTDYKRAIEDALEPVEIMVVVGHPLKILNQHGCNMNGIVFIMTA
ncbi:toll/interleukin-1 receptor domain-containing protein [Verrucomicrobia bacterium]|nr:toll/interleukin-1 receptor domain-containing protein [Verrucomicrobiota bacterium]